MSKKLDLLDEVPCGDKFPTCQFIRDAHLASVELPSLEVSIVTKIEEAKGYKTKVVSVNSAEMISVIDSYNSTIINKNNIFGTQFHPEKSSFSGRKILQNFNLLISNML